MNSRRFDTLARRLATGVDRRALLAEAIAFYSRPELEFFVAPPAIRPIEEARGRLPNGGRIVDLKWPSPFTPHPGPFPPSPYPPGSPFNPYPWPFPSAPPGTLNINPNSFLTRSAVVEPGTFLGLGSTRTAYRYQVTPTTLELTAEGGRSLRFTRAR